MLKKNENWRNNSIFCDIFIIGSIPMGGLPALPPGYAYVWG